MQFGAVVVVAVVVTYSCCLYDCYSHYYNCCYHYGSYLDTARRSVLFPDKCGIMVAYNYFLLEDFAFVVQATWAYIGKTDSFGLGGSYFVVALAVFGCTIY